MVATILQILATVVPLGIQAIVNFKKNSDGTVSATVTLTQADAAFSADIATAQAWFAAHPANPPA